MLGVETLVCVCSSPAVVHGCALCGAKGADQSGFQPVGVIDMGSYDMMDWT